MLSQRRFFTVALYGIALAMGLAGCSSGPRVPDLGGIYSRAAQDHGPHTNPVIVIPGILGSKLVEGETDQVVWGAFGGGAVDPETTHGAQLVAVPMAVGQPLESLKDNVRHAGALDQLKVNFYGIPLELDAYRHILTTLGVGGYRDEMLGKAGAIDYGDDHYTCFQFDYD